MLTICRCGHPDPRPPSPSPSFIGKTRHRARHQSTGRQAAQDGTFKKVLVLGRGRSCCSPSQRQDGGGERSQASRGEVGPRGVRGRVPSERPGGGGGKEQRSPRRPGRGGPRLLAGRPASVPKVGGEAHLDSGPSVRAATARVRLVLSGPVACARVATSPLPSACWRCDWATEGARQPFYKPQACAGAPEKGRPQPSLRALGHTSALATAQARAAGLPPTRSRPGPGSSRPRQAHARTQCACAELPSRHRYLSYYGVPSPVPGSI